MPTAVDTAAVVVIVALLLAEVALIAFCLVDLVRRQSEAVTFGSKLPWYFIIVLLGFIGPIVYLAAGRREPPEPDEAAAVRPGEASSQHRAERALDLLYQDERDD